MIVQPNSADHVIAQRDNPWDEPAVTDEPFVNVTSEPYGAARDGVTDDTAAIQAAMDAAGDGGTVLFPAGTYRVDTAAIISPDRNIPTDGKLVLSGHGAIIKPTSAGGFLSLLRDENDGDVFKNVTVDGFSFDLSAMPAAANWCVIGNITLENRGLGASFRDLTFSNLSAYGEVENASYIHSLIWIEHNSDGNGSATRYYGTGITLRDISMTGGDTLAFIGANPTVTTPLHNHVNFWMDDVLISRCHHDRSGKMTLPNYHTNSFQIGGHSYGGSCRFENCSSTGADDCSFEANGFLKTTFTNCHAIDWINAGFYMPNFTDRTDSESQHIIFRDCSCRSTSDDVAALKGWSLQNDSDASDIGSVILDGCSFQSDKSDAWTFAIYATTVVRELTLRDFKLQMTGFAIDYGPSSGILLQTVAPADSPFRFTCEDMTAYVEGSYDSGDNASYDLISWRGDDGVFDIDGLTFGGNLTCPSAGNLNLNAISTAVDSPITYGGSIRRFAWNDLHSAGDGVMVVAFAGNTVRGVTIEDCDYSASGSSWYDGRRVIAGTSSDKAYFSEHGCRYTAAPVPATVTVDSSPYVYTNLDLYDELVVIAGGTVSALELSTDGGGTYTNLGATSGSYVLSAGHRLRITQSSAPTVTTIPRP